MAARLVTCDVVQPDIARLPRVSALGVPCAVVIGDGGPGDPGWCIALARADDLSPLDGEPQVVRVFDIEDMERDDLMLMLKDTPRELGWTNDQLHYARDRISERGGPGSAAGLTQNDPLFEFVTRLTTILGVPEANLRDLWAV